MADQQQGQQGPVLTIEKIYLKDASVEVPNAPAVFLENLQPQIDVQMGTQFQQVADGLFETTLQITVTAKAGDRTLFSGRVERTFRSLAESLAARGDRRLMFPARVTVDMPGG